MNKLLQNAISLEALTSLFSQAPVGLAILMGKEHIIANANQQILEYWGKGDHVIGLPVIEALPEIANQEFPGVLKSVFETGETIKGNKVKALLEKDGVMLTYYFDFIYSAVITDKKITGVSVVAINVTDQVLNELKLQERELRFKEILEISDYSIAIYRGEDMIIEFANDAMINTWGKGHTVIGKKLEDTLPEIKGQPFIGLLKNVFKTGEPYITTEEKADLVIDGTLQTFYYSFAYRPIKDVHGNVEGILNLALNVTELVQARMIAQNTVKEYRDLAEAMPQIVWTTDENNKIKYFNENMRKFLNLEMDAISDYDFSKVIHATDYINLKRTWDKATLEKKLFELECRFFDAENDKYIWFLTRATPVLDDCGQIKQWIGTCTNIDEFKSLAAQKDTFLGIASHELKTPLTSLKLYAQVLERMLRKTGDETNAEFAKKMDAQIVKLTALINDLLDVTKINSGKIHLNKEYFDFDKLVAETVEEQQMSTSCEIDLQIEDAGIVFADRNRISQVIVNLISNAIKYSPRSKQIIVKVMQAENNVKFSCQDFGIGMPLDKMNRVFEQYYRVSGVEQTTFPGLGLGLYISAQIVERSEGKIWVESVLEEGSTFYFSLPLSQNENI